MSVAFKILALVLGVAAVVLWYFGMNDAAFVTVVAGCVSFFLSVRSEVRGRAKSE